MAHNESQGGWSQWQHQQHHHQHQQRSISSSVGALGRFALRALDLKNGPARIVITIFTLFFTRCSHPFTFTGRCLSYPILFFSSAPVSNRHLNIASTSLAFLFLSSFAPFFLSFSTFTTRISPACVYVVAVSVFQIYFPPKYSFLAMNGLLCSVAHSVHRFWPAGTHTHAQAHRLCLCAGSLSLYH